MGGLHSEVRILPTNILLESAIPSTLGKIRKTGNTKTLQTDASYRFEKRE